MSYQPPSGPGPAPYVGPPAPAPGRPRWTRKRVLLPLLAVLFFLGLVLGIGSADDTAGTENAADAKAGPTTTVTATPTTTPEPAVTETVTADPEPAPTVTRTKTVRVTVAPAADDNDSGDSDGSSGSGGGSTYYANCTAVRAAGAAPIRSGDPGYGSHLDRDGDGVACE
ncbi:excalibur calcium-binding domain-containing protein [Streptomyces sp. NPDC058653]|uniref:excalibur calcium-binding domain-containing protein n=1 Tax=Streptomyces sp. NPDC058653 TaxID=3346576 RepID=UPI0036511482